MILSRLALCKLRRACRVRERQAARRRRPLTRQGQNRSFDFADNPLKKYIMAMAFYIF